MEWAPPLVFSGFQTLIVGIKRLLVGHQLNNTMSPCSSWSMCVWYVWLDSRSTEVLHTVRRNQAANSSYRIHPVADRQIPTESMLQHCDQVAGTAPHMHGNGYTCWHTYSISSIDDHFKPKTKWNHIVCFGTFCSNNWNKLGHIVAIIAWVGCFWGGLLSSSYHIVVIFIS